MIWILDQAGTRLLCVTAIQIAKYYGDSATAPPRYRIWVVSDGSELIVAEYSAAAQAEEAFRAIMEAVKSGAKFVDLRLLDA